MIGHSITLDYPGFPYLSPACYKYMIGNQDQALTLCRPDDAEFNMCLKRLVKAAIFLCRQVCAYPH